VSRRPAAPFRRRLLPLCLAGLWTGLALPQAAQAAYRGRNFSMDRPRVGGEIAYRFDSEERSGPFVVAARQDNQLLSERIDIETQGWIYHPALVTYTARLSPEWRQRQTTSGGSSASRSTETLLGYDIRLTVLPYKPYTVNLFARQQSSVFSASLAPQTEMDNSTLGATLHLKSKLLPTRLLVQHATVDQTGFYEARETRDEFRLNSRHRAQNHDSRFELAQTAHERTQLPAGTTMRTENLFWTLQNNYRFSRPGRYLVSSLNYNQSRSNGSEYTSLNLNESINWRHSKRLTSFYGYQFMQTGSNGQTIDQNSVNAGLAHSLYENLSTSVGASASSGSQGDSSYGGNVNFNYQRRIPGGSIRASLGQDYRIRHPAQGVFHVLQETLSVPIGGTQFLTNRNVVAGSVRVTDLGGSPQFLGLDYDLQTIGTTLGIINRKGVPFTFVISYDYQNPTYASATHGQSFGVGVSLGSTWRLDYRYSHAREDFLSGIPPAVLGEDTRHTIDSDLKWRWSTTRFLYESNESTLGVSMKRWRVEENVVYRPNVDNFYSAGVHFGQMKLQNQAGADQFQGVSASWQRIISSRSRGRLEAMYNINDGTVVKTRDMGVAASWEWIYGIWRADATYRFLDQQDQVSGQSRKRHSFFVGLNRSLW